MSERGENRIFEFYSIVMELNERLKARNAIFCMSLHFPPIELLSITRYSC